MLCCGNTKCIDVFETALHGVDFAFVYPGVIQTFLVFNASENGCWSYCLKISDKRNKTKKRTVEESKNTLSE